MRNLLTLSMIMVFSNSCSLYAVDLLRIGCVNPIYISDAPINEMLKAEENVIKGHNDRKEIDSKLKDEFLKRYNNEKDALKKAELMKQFNEMLLKQSKKEKESGYGIVYYTRQVDFARFSINASVPKGYNGKLWLAFKENNNYSYVKFGVTSKIDLENVSFCFDRNPSFSTLEIYNDKERSFHSLVLGGQDVY